MSDEADVWWAISEESSEIDVGKMHGA